MRRHGTIDNYSVLELRASPRKLQEIASPQRIDDISPCRSHTTSPHNAKKKKIGIMLARPQRPWPLHLRFCSSYLPQRKYPLQLPMAYKCSVRRICFADSDQLLSCRVDQTITLWDARAVGQHSLDLNSCLGLGIGQFGCEMRGMEGVTKPIILNAWRGKTPQIFVQFVLLAHLLYSQRYALAMHDSFFQNLMMVTCVSGGRMRPRNWGLSKVTNASQENPELNRARNGNMIRKLER
jgi:hypothetical protein